MLTVDILLCLARSLMIPLPKRQQALAFGFCGTPYMRTFENTYSTNFGE